MLGVAIDLSAYLVRALNMPLHFWKRDLVAFSPENLVRKPGPDVRSAAEIACEIVQENLASAKMLRGEDPGPYLGFPDCPPEMASADRLVEAITASVEEILAAVGDPEREVVTSEGTRTAFDLALFVKFHMEYHVGQINLLHTLYGDTKVHWG